MVVPLAGVLIGTLLGFVARRTHFCTLTAFERSWYAGDTLGLRTWVLAAASATLFTQIMSLTGMIDISDTFYLDAQLPLTGSILGGLAFGIGMALVGTCGFGALIRMGGGSLKAFVALIVLGLSALAAQRGLIAQARVVLVDDLAIDMSFAGSQSIADIISTLAGTDLRVIVLTIILVAAFAWIFAEPAMRKNKSGIATGFAVGALIAAGWVVTDWGSANAFAPVQIEAGSFVVPVADTILQFVTFTGVLPDYGVGLVIGVVLGAAIAAALQHDIRWEACDDARELSRHMAGAFLMGTGGVFAFGCTIGQGVTGASTLALSVPFTMASIALGARIGLSWMVEGTLWPASRSH